MKQPGAFHIVDQLQRYDVDIKGHQLCYKQKRVMVSKAFTFDAAHHLHAYEGKCKNLHGHTYKVEFGISSMINDIGLALDFGDIKHIWKERIEPYLDHRYLNETLPPMNTTAENMVIWLFEQMDAALAVEPHKSSCVGGRTEFVRLYETPTSYAEARREWMME
ncbi:6-carboxytetrahydropterin synthase QueD [Paenibacillus agilis]|uniref:6-carboxy-5,6,7,8-tetrahydropterin synthase n=1 Tax=Paenibacillus agilis TaxID=3020863 RepID=A0A559IBW6_9BACL|nr:6-carboxytetrahydropterin synthase QueD [Paenibacillus agilis]TVX85159.1 6-carboxytetrahydropterin synthase QueD [Paenibacillus agilis]